MTFKEKLIDVSNMVDLELFIAKHCAAIQDKMENAAKSGYRTFQIEIARVISNDVTLTAPDADNCYAIISTNKPDKMALILNMVKDYLYQLGFSHNDIEQMPIKNNMYHAAVLKVEW